MVEEYKYCSPWIKNLIIDNGGLFRTIIEANTGPLITHQIAALSFKSQQLQRQTNAELHPETGKSIQNSYLTKAHPHSTSLLSLYFHSMFLTYPMSSKYSLSTAQMVTHRVGVPVRAQMTNVQKELQSGDKRSLVKWSHPSRWWCTSRSISSRGRRSPPVRWTGKDPRWRARSNWTRRSNGRKSWRHGTPAAGRGAKPWAVSHVGANREGYQTSYLSKSRNQSDFDFRI